MKNHLVLFYLPLDLFDKVIILHVVSHSFFSVLYVWEFQYWCKTYKAYLNIAYFIYFSCYLLNRELDWLAHELDGRDTHIGSGSASASGSVSVVSELQQNQSSYPSTTTTTIHNNNISSNNNHNVSSSSSSHAQRAPPRVSYTFNPGPRFCHVGIVYNGAFYVFGGK